MGPAVKIIPEAFVLERMLGQSVLFRGADEDTLSEAAQLFTEVTFKKDAPIFLENEVSNYLYFVKSGTIEVRSYNPRLRQLNVVRTAGPGEHISEMSVLTRANHSTSCFAVTDTVLLSMDYQTFTGLLFTKPAIARNLVIQLALLNQKMTQSHSYVEYLKETDFAFHPSFPRMIPIDYFSQYEVLPIRLDGSTLMVALTNSHNGNFFDAFKKLNPNTSLKIRIVSRADFARLTEVVKKHYFAKQTPGGGPSIPPPLASSAPSTPQPASDLPTLLSFTTIFSRLDPTLIEKLLPHFRAVTFDAGETIFVPGSPSRSLYLIQSGKVSLQKGDSEAGSTQVALLNPNDSFGEISLLLDANHSLFAVAASPVSMFTLSKSIVAQLLTRPEFSVPLARVLAERLQSLNRTLQVRLYPDEIPPSSQLPLHVLPEVVMKAYQILPIRLKENELVLGLVNPEEGLINMMISRYLSSYRLTLFRIHEHEYNSAWNRLGKEGAPKPVAVVDPAKPEAPLANVIEFTEKLIADAVTSRTSDIHIEPREGFTLVRFRIDGRLQERGERLEKAFGAAVSNRIKILGQMDVGEKRLPQDGSLNMKIDELQVNARISSVPSVFGEKLVLRIAKADQSVPPLNSLAPDKQVIGFLRDVVKYSQGVFLITGPTGSGKTTTLYALLNEMNTYDRNIVTVENPVEIMVPGLTQISINDKIGLGFDRVLRHVLRQDPNVIMIGEIRDKQSAQFAFEAALTGHLVFTTLHTNTSLDILPRLRELDVGAALLSTGLLGVMAQRLLPKLCMNCRIRRKPTPEESEILQTGLSLLVPPRETWAPVGCPKCENTGYSGRIPVFEYWKNGDRERYFLVRESPVSELREHLKVQKFRSLYQFGLQMAVNGLTDVETVAKYLYGMGEESHG